MHDFVTSLIGHLKNFDSLRYTDPPNVDTLIAQHFKKITFININIDFIWKIL